MLLHGVRCIHGKANDQKQCVSNLSFTQNFLKAAVILLSWFYTWSQMLLLHMNLK